MKLSVSLKARILSEYEDRGSSSFFTIFWQHTQESYPTDSWMDFGAILLGWWIVATLKLLRGERHQDLVFMDGPYRLSLELGDDGSTITCTAPNSTIRWITSLDELANEVRSSALAVIRQLEQFGIDQKERRALQIGLAQLQKSLEETTEKGKNGKGDFESGKENGKGDIVNLS
jgi:hypothetical protein